MAKKSKRYKKLSRKRDYGLVILINKLKKEIRRTVYNRKMITRKLRTLWEQTKQGHDLDAFLLDYGVEEKRLERFTKSINKIFHDAMNRGGSKVMTVTGKDVKIQKPSYQAAVSAMKNRGLELVEDLSQDHKDKIKKVMKQGFDKGKTYSEVSKDVVDEVKSMSESRAKLIASTEMNLAVNRGMTETMQHNNINSYHYVTAGDNKVAEICNMNSKGTRDGSGKLLKHTVGKGPMPVKDSHPRCRCVIVKAKE